MAQILEKDKIVDLRGFPVPPAFHVGGKCGNAVTHSSTSLVHRGWRVIAVDGRRVEAAEVSAVLSTSRQRSRYTVTFRLGEGDDDAAAELEADRVRREAEERAAREEADRRAAEAAARAE